jgi:hypothetical protein
MPQTVLLNNLDHKDLHVITRRSAALGDQVMLAHTFASEFRQLQAHYPIVFQKSDTGSFHPVALLGLKAGENLFLGPDGWEAGPVPLALAREPFYIGQQGDELLVHIDLGSSRIGDAATGEPLFLPHGGSSELLEHITSVLLTIHEGLQATPAFMAALLQHELLESFVLDVEDADGASHRLAGFYTIHEERLADLPAQVLHQLHRAGHLQAVYMALASLSQLQGLVDRHRRRLAAGR